ncbi:hypothetical protein DL98DRAFT_572402 [Cadophora sp. DSE1049]|nr:hypothetical protein DL98DRAFT_572402 [Cadophora sp. DSE1049]
MDVPVAVPASIPKPALIKAPEPSNILSTLLSTGQFSDLTITCREQVFRVHRAVVCPQSKPLAAAEAQTGTIDLDDRDPEVIAKFLHYLYHGDYSDNSEIIPKDGPVSVSKDSQIQSPSNPATAKPQSTDLAQNTPSNTSTNPGSSDAKQMDPLLLNTHLFALADYFSIPPLSTLSLTKFQSSLLTRYNTHTPSLVHILTHLYPLNPSEMYSRDDPLRAIAIWVAGRNAGVLQDKGEFVALCKENARVAWAVMHVVLNEGQERPTPKRCPWWPANWQHYITYRFKSERYWCEACCKEFK